MNDPRRKIISSVFQLPSFWSRRKTPFSRSRLFCAQLITVSIILLAHSGIAGGPAPILPASSVEGSGVLTNAGQVVLAENATSNVVVKLQSSDLALLTLPTSVTILSGQSNVFFDITIGDNLIAEGNHSVTVTAATDFSTNETTILLIDNDPDHIQFAAVPSITDTNSGFAVQVKALNADGTVQTNFSARLTLTATGLEGPLPLATPDSGNFVLGQQTVNIQVTTPGYGVRIGCLEYPGLSDAFTVIPPPFYTSSQPVSDIVWDRASQTLLASVPATGGEYSNCLVAIDPATGQATNSYSVGFDPSQIEISPEGHYLYLTLSNRTMLQRFNLDTRSAGVPFVLGTGSNPFRYAYDFCIPPGMTDSVVVAARLQDNIGNTSIDGIYRYDSGSPVPLPNFTASGWLVESMDSGFRVALSPNLSIGDASTGIVSATNPNSPGEAVIYRAGEFFDDRGNAFSGESLAQLGSYPGVLEQIYYKSLPEVDPVFRRAFYLAGYYNYGTTFYKLKAYDLDLFLPLFQWPMPSAAGSPTRLIRCGTNCLAYVTGNSQLWFIRPEATQPPRPAADLSLSVSASGAAPIAGSAYTFSLTLTNIGPGTASVVQVTNALPENTVALQTQPSTGSVSQGDTGFIWKVSDLAAGSVATLQVTVQFNNGGGQTNTAWALGYELDANFTNNIASLPVNVQLPQEAFGVFAVNYTTQDLIYDPVRDRLLLSVTNGAAPVYSNGLAVFNPYTGLTESFVASGVAPGDMARSDDGQFLYVSLPDAGTVEKFELPTLTFNSSFAVGGEEINGVQYTNYARSLAVVPGQPDSLVAWNVRHPYNGSLEHGYGIALYQDGVKAPNVTDAGGSWKAVFDTDSGTLLGYNAGDLRRCDLDTNGVTFAEQYPTLYLAGNDIEYGGGHLFNTGGEMLNYDPFQVEWVFAGAQNSTLVEPDPVSGRVFFLTQNGTWQIKAYDVLSRRLLGSLAVPNLAGTPSKLIRWGADGLAFQTTGHQLFVIRTPLARTDIFTDLAMNLAGPVGPLTPGDNASFNLTVTNQGTLQATNVVITNTVSAGASLLSISTSAGTWATNADGRTVVWSIPALDVGAQATLSWTGITLQPGLITAVAAATTDTFDPAPSNNTAVATVLIGGPAGPDDSFSFQLPVNDVVWSPSLARFLVTANASLINWSGALLSVDPESLDVQFKSQLGVDSGRLALSQDDTLLYAGTDSGVTEITIPSLAITNHFIINPTQPNAYAYDLKIVPGSNGRVAIGAKTTANNTTWVTAFEHGVQLLGLDTFYSTVLSLEFGDQPSPLYAYNGSFNRYALDTNGVTVLDSTAGLLPASTAMNLVWGNGRLYSSAGTVINPSDLTVVGSLTGIPSGSQVVYDSVSGLAFYLSPGANRGVLNAFDGDTLLPAGSRSVAGVTGNITRFIHWGVDGFAAITSNHQFVIFHSSLIPTNPPADVSVSLALSPPPYHQGSNLTATLTLSNAGPNAATSITWSNSLPAGAKIVSANSSAGSLTTNSISVAGVIPLLDVGASATAAITFFVPAPGIVSDQIMATASSIDPNFANNSATALLWILPTNGSSGLVSLTLPVKDLEHDPMRPVLYASLGSSAGVAANSVVTIDAVNKMIGPTVVVGSNPGRLAVSADGQFLYVALDGSGVVEKRSLPSLSLLGSFAVPQNQTVVRMCVCPTNSDMVAIRRSPAGMTSLHVGGVERPKELGAQDLFAFVDNTGQLFGCDGAHSNVKLYELNTDTNGLSLMTGQPGKQSSATDLQSSGGLLFFNGGLVINPATTRGVDRMPVPYNSLVAPDASCGRVFYITPIPPLNVQWSLRAFDIGQGIEVGSVSLPFLTSAPQKLLRWGVDGLALFNANSQVVILSGQLIPTNPPADVVLTQSVSAPTAMPNDPITISLQLTNREHVTASGVVVTQNFSMALTNVSLLASIGTATYTNQVVTWPVGDLPTGTQATLILTGRASQTGTLTVTAYAKHNLNDVFWGNNAVLSVVNIANPNPSNTLTLQLSARLLAYDSARNVIYASTPATNQLMGNLIAELDPATGSAIGALPAGSEPSQICLSEDANYLYAALDGEMGVRRFNLNTMSVNLAFGFATNDIYYAQDLVVQPGNSDTVVASLSSYNMAANYPSTVWAYDHGVARANSGGPARGLAFAADGSTVFGKISPGSGAAFERMTLDSQGFSSAIVGGFTTDPGNLKYSEGRLYGTSGQVVDANSGTLIGSVPASGPQAVDNSAGRAFYLTQSGSTWQIRAFNLADLQSTGTQAVLNVKGTPSSLIRCGQDRLAFLTSAGQVFIVHTPLTIANATNPPSPTLTLLYEPSNQANPFVLQIGGQQGYWYTIYASTNLVHWSALGSVLATMPVLYITDPAASDAPFRFYKVTSP